MKDQWHNLSLREKQTVCLGAAVVISFLLYLLVWSPLTNTVEKLRTQVQRDQALLDWMRQAETRIQSTEKSIPTKSSATDISLLTILQKQINKTSLVSSLTQLHQADNDSVQLNFTNASFDTFIEWLTQLWREQGVAVSQINIIATTTQGIVNIDCRVSKT